MAVDKEDRHDPDEQISAASISERHVNRSYDHRFPSVIGYLVLHQNRHPEWGN